MNKICYVNGIYLTEKVSGGAKRVALETIKALENIDTDIKFVVLCPKDAELSENNYRVEYKKIGKFTGNKWEQISLPRYVNRNKGLCLSLCNSYPVFAKRNLIVVFDVRPKEELNLGIRNKFIKKFDFLMKRAKKKSIPVITISNFSKNRICDLYDYPEELVNIMRLGYEHCKTVEDTADVNNNLQEEFYLSVSSVSKHKNFEFIINLATRFPDEKFYIIGNKVDKVDAPIPSNVTFLGRLSDNQLASFYRRAKAFISSSLYEGFGLTPLEAIYYGCKVLYLSDIEVFREIFNEASNFFDPHDAEKFEFGEKLTISEEKRLEILENYSWINGATDLLNVIKRYVN